MNERIKELYEQAHEEQSPISGQGRLTKDILWEQPRKFNPEKFAELIVAECATAFEAEVDTWKEMDPYQGSIKRQGTKAIKQHFGVEE